MIVYILSHIYISTNTISDVVDIIEFLNFETYI